MPTTDGELTKTLPIRPGMTIVGKYRIERLIAAGGMGAVLQAHHEVLDQTVAIKLMRPELASHPEASQRFLREARAAAKIESDFVARVTDVDLWENTPFMVMQYLVGGDLSAVIDDEDTVLPVSDAVDYVMQALAGLQAAHTIGVIHRDLKPSNLFLVSRADKSTRLKILDFGISKVVGDDTDGLRAGANTSTQAMLGTPRYMSPEQVSSAKDVDVRTDLWAMGLILYELLTKAYPFEGDNAGAILAAIITAEVAPPRTLRAEIPAELEAIILKLLAKDRQRRYPNARKAMRALAPFASRRVQALLMERDELIGAEADTETHGTPSEVLSLAPAQTSAVLAATAQQPDDQPNADDKARSEPTETSMSVAGVPKAGGGTARLVGAVVAAAGIIALALYLTRDESPPRTSAAPTVEATTPPIPSASVAPPATVDAPPAVAPSSEAVTAAQPSALPSASAATPTPLSRPVVRPQPPPPSGPPASPKPKPRDLLNDWD